MKEDTGLGSRASCPHCYFSGFVRLIRMKFTIDNRNKNKTTIHDLKESSIPSGKNSFYPDPPENPEYLYSDKEKHKKLSA